MESALELTASNNGQQTNQDSIVNLDNVSNSALTSMTPFPENINPVDDAVKADAVVETDPSMVSASVPSTKQSETTSPPKNPVNSQEISSLDMMLKLKEFPFLSDLISSLEGEQVFYVFHEEDCGSESDYNEPTSAPELVQGDDGYSYFSDDEDTTVDHKATCNKIENRENPNIYADTWNLSASFFIWQSENRGDLFDIIPSKYLSEIYSKESRNEEPPGTWKTYAKKLYEEDRLEQERIEKEKKRKEEKYECRERNRLREEQFKKWENEMKKSKRPYQRIVKKVPMKGTTVPQRPTTTNANPISSSPPNETSSSPPSSSPYPTPISSSPPTLSSNETPSSIPSSSSNENPRKTYPQYELLKSQGKLKVNPNSPSSAPLLHSRKSNNGPGRQRSNSVGALYAAKIVPDPAKIDPDAPKGATVNGCKKRTRPGAEQKSQVQSQATFVPLPIEDVSSSPTNALLFIDSSASALFVVPYFVWILFLNIFFI